MTATKVNRWFDPMTSDQYRTAIKSLGLSQERAGEMLGIAPRTSQGYALGEYPVPDPVAKLLDAYERIQYLEAKRLYTCKRIAVFKAELDACRKIILQLTDQLEALVSFHSGDVT